MELWQITYTHKILGTRHTYMDVGYEKPESAKEEIKRLQRDAAKYKKDYAHFDLNEIFKNGIRIPSAMIGKNWRIKKVKCRKP